MRRLALCGGSDGRGRYVTDATSSQWLRPTPTSDHLTDNDSTASEVNSFLFHATY